MPRGERMHKKAECIFYTLLYFFYLRDAVSHSANFCKSLTKLYLLYFYMISANFSASSLATAIVSSPFRAAPL